MEIVDFNIRETKKIVENFRDSGLSHYLYCSSCWAHGMAETIPFDPDDLRKEPLDDYGKDKFAKEIFLPNFGQEILHHVHGYDVAQVFFQAITHRNQALGESFLETIDLAVKSYIDRGLIQGLK